MDNGPSNSDICNDCNFGVDSFDKAVGASIKSNARCNDVSYEWMGSYDAGFLTRFRPFNSIRKNTTIKSICTDLLRHMITVILLISL